MDIREPTCKYDANAGVLYVTFIKAPAENTTVEDRQVVVRRSENGELLGITILDVENGS